MGADGEQILISKLSTDDFVAIFKQQTGDDLSSIIRTSLEFGRTVNADQDMKEILAKAEKALKRIGRESLINRRRVQNKYGVKVGK